MPDQIQEEVQVQAVSLKLPTFWTLQPEVWFHQAESQFVSRQITTSSTKYLYVVAALDQDTAQRILDLLDSPPAADPYTAIKERLLRAYTLSEFERGQRLINPPLLGDDKPSVLMSKMTALLGTHQPCFLFRALFLQRLPEFIQSTLVHSKVEDCQELAKAAGILWSTHQQTTNAVSTTSARSGENTGNANTMSKVCWPHRKFGENATCCSQPCTYTPLGNGKVDCQ